MDPCKGSDVRGELSSRSRGRSGVLQVVRDGSNTMCRKQYIYVTSSNTLCRKHIYRATARSSNTLCRKHDIYLVWGLPAPRRHTVTSGSTTWANGPAAYA
jgi:hypothetical protein